MMALAVWALGITFPTVIHLIGLSYPSIRVIYAIFKSYVSYYDLLLLWENFLELQKVKRRIAVENTFTNFQNNYTVLQQDSKAVKTMATVIGALSINMLSASYNSVHSVATE